MYVKYVMQSGTDYRGAVKLIVRNEDGDDVAYSSVAVKDGDMTDLIQAEIDLVKRATNGHWDDVRDSLIIEVDARADAVRQLLRPPKAETVEVEYMQVEMALRQWELEGSDPNAVPAEIQVWADIKNETVDWAVNDIRVAIHRNRTAIQAVRYQRLLGKERLRTCNNEDVDVVFQETLAALAQIETDILATMS